MNIKTLKLLDSISEGIIILSKDYKILAINDYMELILARPRDEVLNLPIFELLPKLNDSFFIKAMEDAFEKDYKYFFSSSVHKNLISDKLDINIKLTPYMANEEKYLMLECVNVTNQLRRINKLNDHVRRLDLENKALRAREDELSKTAYLDDLTGLAGRKLLYEFSNKYIAKSLRNNSKLAVLFIDVDRFKAINDIYGHCVGDRVLIEIGSLLEKSVRDSDLVSRYGGDEFVVLLSEIEEINQINVIARRIVKSMESIKVDGFLEEVKLSIGVSIFPDHGRSLNELISSSDKAMYRAKKSGGSTTVIHDEDLLELIK